LTCRSSRGGRLERTEPFGGPDRVGPHRDEVTEQPESVDTNRLRVGNGGVERDGVPVNVGEDSDQHDRQYRGRDLL
jgi:hypothetical protein